MEDYQNIEIRSEEVQEILGTPPRWIVRWGTTFAVLSVLILCFVAWMIKYPETHKVPVVITTSSPAVEVEVEEDTEVNILLVKAGEKVGGGDDLAVVNTQADYQDLKNTLNEFKNILQNDAVPGKLEAYRPDKTRNLGELQDDYLYFLRLYDKRFSIKSKSDKSVTLLALEKEKENIKANIDLLKMKEQLALKEQEVADLAYQTQRKLYGEKKTPIDRLQNARADQLAKQQLLKTINENIILKEKEIINLDQKTLETQDSFQDNDNNDLIAVKSSMSALHHEMELWIDEHTILAPISGQVKMPEDGAKTKLEKGESLLAIAPQNSKGQRIIGKVELPKSLLPRIKPGQRVVIHLDGYPYLDYGSFEGEIGAKAVQRKGAYIVEVNLSRGLESSHNKRLKFEQGLTGQAEIILEEKRLLEKIFQEFIRFFKW